MKSPGRQWRSCKEPVKDRGRVWPGNLPAAGEVHLTLGSKYQVQLALGSCSLSLPSGDPGQHSCWEEGDARRGTRENTSQGSAGRRHPAGRETGPTERAWALTFLQQENGWKKLNPSAEAALRERATLLMSLPPSV